MHTTARLFAIVALVLFIGAFVFPSLAYTQSILDVPFTSQAPTAEWRDDRFQNGCEEAAVLMAMQWIKDKKTLSKKQAKKEIIAMAKYQKKTYGSAVDTSAQDTADRLFKEYYGYTRVEVKYDITAQDIRAELEKGHLVIAPMNGRKLKNPFFKRPGPLTHMLLIRGYDAKKREFITNDPGTRHGELFRYTASVLKSALRDYPTGNHLPITQTTKVMIVVRK